MVLAVGAASLITVPAPGVTWGHEPVKWEGAGTTGEGDPTEVRNQEGKG